MADTIVERERIGPKLDLADVEFPPAVGEQLAVAYGVDRPIETGREWVEVTRESLADSVDRTPTVDDLCTSPDGVHTFEGDGTARSYVCVLDPLAYPFLTDTPGTVRSETPVRGETVEITVAGDGATVSHEDAVVSLGVSGDVDPADEVTPAVIYRQVCGYIHVFADGAEYEQWAADGDGVTMSVPATDGVAIARELASELFR